MKIKIEVEFKEEHAEYFNSEFPAYIAYWGRYRRHDRVIEEYIEFARGDHEPVVQEHALPENWIEKGLNTLAASGYHRLGELIEGEYDAESLDCLVQAAIFGEVKYG